MKKQYLQGKQDLTTPLTLRELYETEYPDVMWIGIYEGPDINIIVDYADEYLETHGDYEVINYGYNKDNNGVLIVELNMQ